MKLVICSLKMAGYQENASATLIHLTGLCCIENLYGRVFSLNLVICGFEILATLFPKIPIRGL